MAKYYYGDVLLPEIPVVDGYPYCFIRKTEDTGYYDLVYSKLLPVYNNGSIKFHNGSYLVQGDCMWYRIQLSTASTATDWTFNLSTTDTWSLNANRYVIWSNTYILNDSASATDIYFYGSRPIPEDGYIPTAKYYYNNILLPEVPVIEGYPYCFIRKTDDTGFYDLIYSKLIPIYDGDSHIGYANGSTIGTSGCVWYRIQISTVYDTMDWMLYLNTTDWWSLNANRSVIWSNHDIPSGSATSSTIYFYGSEPEGNPTLKVLEYIEATGTQYIDTGIVPTNHQIEIKFDCVEYNNDEHLFGTSSMSYYYHFTTYNNSYYWGYNGTEGNGGSWTAGLHTLVYNAIDNHRISLDGVILAEGTPCASSDVLWLFRRENAINFKGKLYYVKITDRETGELVRDFIPVLNEANVACLYDKITGSYFYNQGTGSFLANFQAYNFDGKKHSDNSWVDTLSSKGMSVAKGSFIWEDNYLVVTKDTNYFNLPTDYGSHGTFEILAKIDESFTPIANNNWYNCSCVFGCELSGQQQDWGIIIDRNGYYAIGYGFSSIASTDVKANDGQWHTLAMVVGSSDMRLYIDGVLKQSVSITLGGTAISTFGVGWNKENSTKSVTGHIGTIKVWTYSLSEEEVLKSYKNSVKWLLNRSEKYLLMSNALIYTVTDGVLTQITDSLTSNTFENFGLDELPESSIILGLANPKILYWTDAEDFHATKVTMTATPNPQSIITNSIDLSHPTIVGINSITGECSGSPLFSCEFNGVWKEHDGTAWIDSVSGMTYETLSVITPEQWDKMTTGLVSFKLKVILDSADDKVTKLNVNYNFDVTQAVAPNEEVISDV